MGKFVEEKPIAGFKKDYEEARKTPPYPVPLSAHHNTTVHKTAYFFRPKPPYQGGMQRFPFVVVCSCQWQSYADTEHHAEIVGAQHAHNQTNHPSVIPQGHL